MSREVELREELTSQRSSPTEKSFGEELVRIEHVSKVFPGQRALYDVSLSVRAGEVHALVGPNGCGKSTLIKILTGYHRPEPGAEGWIHGENAEFKTPGGLTSLHGRPFSVRAVHQNLGLLLEMDAVENIGLVTGFQKTRVGRVAWSRQRERTRELLAKIGAPDFPIRRPLAQCNLLQRTQVALARVLSEWPSNDGLLILDEPTAALHFDDVSTLFECIAEVKRLGIGVLYVSHRLPELFRIADRVTVVREGEIVGTRHISEISEDDIVSMMLGGAQRHASAAPDQTAERGDGLALEACGVVGRTVERLDLRVAQGEVLGLVGALGSGADELPYLLSGNAPAVEGTLRIGGAETDMAHLDPRAAAQLGVGHVPSDRALEGLVANFSLTENVTLPEIRRFVSRGRLRGRRERAFAVSLIKDLEVKPPNPRAAVATLSGGNQQKLVLGKWLPVADRALILSEPTAGVDIGTKRAIYDLLQQTAASRPVIVFSTDLVDIMAVCTRVLAFNGGRVVAELFGDEITEEGLLRPILAPTREVA
jgi:ribose transport system ATP-binding protein